MKLLSDQDYYEILEIARGASPEEIERAYRLASATYSDDSLAGYSVFETGDAEVIRERLDTAYRTLSDPESRRSYDASIERAAVAEVAEAVSADFERVAVEKNPSPPLEPLEAFEDLEETGGDFDGARLRRARLRRGIELDDIAGVTKINPTYLAFIEEERFEDLPAAVYVRGFVMGYAQTIGLDPPEVAKSYMRRYEESRGDERRGIFSRR